MFRNILALILIASASIASYAQASVVENQSSRLYVSAQTGSDNNPGTSTAPLRTIQAAVNKANSSYIQRGVGVKVEIVAGVYREAVSVNASSTNSPALTIEAEVPGTVFIDGANVLAGWSQSGSIYSRAWTAESTCSIPNGWPTNFPTIVTHKETFFINGVPLTQVLAYADLRPGTFFTSALTVYIDPPAGTSVAGSVIEASVRPSLFTVNSRHNTVVRGLVFEHANNCFNTSAAEVNSSSNVLIDQVSALWNNWGGFGIYSSSKVTVQNSTASYNGGVGFSGNHDLSTLLLTDESDYNNWRGAQGAYYEWAMGGTKFFESNGVTVQNHMSFNNQAEGLWFDTDNKNIVIKNATLVGSKTAALQIERNPGPITLESSHLCSSGVGVNLLTSESVTIKDNSFYNNGATGKYQAQIYLAGQSGGIKITDWQTGQVYDLFSTGTDINGNTFVDGSAGQLVFGTYLNSSDWSDFTRTLLSDNNVWYDAYTATPFKIVNGKLLNLNGWRASVGVDKNSIWGMPAISLQAACTPPVPTYADYQVTVDATSYGMASGRATVTTRVESFGYGAVSLAMSGLPAGVTASISSPSLTSGVSVITLSAVRTATNQKVPVTLIATSAGRVHTVTFFLTVVHP